MKGRSTPKGVSAHRLSTVALRGPRVQRRGGSWWKGGVGVGGGRDLLERRRKYEGKQFSLGTPL